MAKKSNKKKSNRQKQIKKRRQQAKQQLAAVSAIKQENLQEIKEKTGKKEEKEQEKTKKAGLGLLFFPLLFLYFELVFHWQVFGFRGIDWLLPCLIGLGVGLICMCLTSVFSRRINLILSWILLAVITFVYCGQRIYYYVFKFVRPAYAGSWTIPPVRNYAYP